MLNKKQSFKIIKNCSVNKNQGKVEKCAVAVATKKRFVQSGEFFNWILLFERKKKTKNISE